MVWVRSYSAPLGARPSDEDSGYDLNADHYGSHSLLMFALPEKLKRRYAGTSARLHDWRGALPDAVRREAPLFRLIQVTRVVLRSPGVWLGPERW